MESDAKGNGIEPAGASTHLGVWRFGAVALLCLIIGVAFYYGTSLERENTFADQKAFRVLAEVITQINNLQTSRATLLNSMPTQIIQSMPECGEQHESITPEEHRRYYQHIKRLDLAAASFCRLQVTQAEAATRPGTSALTSPRWQEQALLDTCKGATRNETRFGINPRGGRLLTALCYQPYESPMPDRHAIERLYHYGIQEPFEKAVSRIVSQDFFTEAVFAMSDGTVLGEFPRHNPQGETEVRLQPSTGERLNIVNVRQLLPTHLLSSSAEVEQDPSKAKIPAPTPAHEPARHPAAAPHDIGNRHFQIYVLPFHSSYEFRQLPASDPKLSDHQPEPRGDDLYVVGLRQINVGADIARDLWPLGSWMLTLLLILCALAWPIFSLVFGPEQEGITALRAVGCMVAALSIPAVLMAAAASVWGILGLQPWMDATMDQYARDLESRLHQDLISGARILSSYKGVFEQFFPTEDANPSGKGPPLAVDPDSGGPVCPTPPLSKLELEQQLATVFPPCNAPETEGTPLIAAFAQNEKGSKVRQHVHACILKVGPEDCGWVRLAQQNAIGPTWSPFRALGAVNSDGMRFGPTLTAFTGSRVKAGLRLDSREYYQALREGQQWVADTPDGQLQFVAERLFNKSDASKSLQLAVPLQCPQPKTDQHGTHFCGLLTGDLRLQNFISPLMPPLVRFAVIDGATGTVIFHSNDSRSLAENFLRETEASSTLIAALRTRQPVHFSGYYQGDPSEFYYLPLTGTPWGIVTFYASKELQNLAVMAAIAALLAYGALIAFVLVMFAPIAVILGMRRCNSISTQDVLAPLWPRAPAVLRLHWVTRFRPSVWAMLTLALATLSSFSFWWSASVAVGSMLVSIGFGWHFRSRSDPGLTRRDSVERWRKSGATQIFAECVTSALVVLAILPTWYVYGHAWQAQLAGVRIDGLLEGVQRLQDRYGLIQQDMQRWISVDRTDPDDAPGDRPVVYEEPWQIAQFPDRGLAPASADGSIGPPVHVIPCSVTKDAATCKARADPPPPQLDFLTRVIWRATAESAPQHRRIALLDESPGTDDVRCSLQPMQCTTKALDGVVLTVSGYGPNPVPISSFQGESRLEDFVVILLCFLLVRRATVSLLRALGRKLFGFETTYARFSQSLSNEVRQAEAHNLMDSWTFKDTWERLSRPERLVLYQIASGQIVNPRNHWAERLFQKTLLLRIAPWPRLRWSAIETEIRHSETPAEFERWQVNANKGIWRSVRVPLFILLMALVAWLSYTEGGSMQALSAILVATAAFLGQLAQLARFARGTPQATKSG